LGDEGYAVATASDGAQALALLAPPPDLVLLDTKMPRLDGRGFLDASRAAPGPRAPVVVLTAALHPDAGEWPDAAAVVAKPFDLDALLRLAQTITGTA
jgi:CheY-like chemotaxis protein